MDGGDDDQPDGQIARAVSAEIERLGERPWIIGAGVTGGFGSGRVRSRLSIVLMALAPCA